MAKPATKEELITQTEGNFATLMNLVESLSPEQLESEFPEGSLNRNVRDVLAHLHHWHIMFLDWYEVGMKDEKPDMPAKGYTWQMMPDLNRKINADYQEIGWQKALELLKGSYKQVFEIMEQHSEEDLFTKKKYKWTGSTSLGIYLISNTCGHYNWAIKFIKKGLR